MLLLDLTHKNYVAALLLTQPGVRYPPTVQLSLMSFKNFQLCLLS